MSATSTSIDEYVAELNGERVPCSLDNFRAVCDGLVARIRHVGGVAVLARRFAHAFADAQRRIAPFMQQWGFAMREDAVERALAAVGSGPVPIWQALPGLFGGILERELVPVPVRVAGGRDAVVKQLVEMYRRDDSAARIDPATGQPRDRVTRAAIVNAFTRYAHEVNDDPWVQREIEQAAGALLWPRRGAGEAEPLPYLPMG